MSCCRQFLLVRRAARGEKLCTMNEQTPEKENYALGQKVTPVALYWMLLALAILNIIELGFIANISAKVSAICNHLHIVFYH